MPQQYDASTKFLVQDRLADWLPLCGRTTTARLEVIDADLATVTASADRVLRVHETPPWLMHLELQASRDADLPARLHTYNTLLERRHEAQVRSVVVLLRKAADASDLTGVLEKQFAGESPYLMFRYGVVRVWQLPVETLLSGGLALVPLAPLGNVTEADLPGLIQRMDGRIRQEAAPELAGMLWTAADVLMGLRYNRALVEHVLRGIEAMEESVTYQAIVEKGELRALRRLLLKLGTEKFGKPELSAEMALQGIADVDRLQRMGERILHLNSWQELLAVS